MHNFLETAINWTEIPAWLAFFVVVLILFPAALFRRPRPIAGALIVVLTWVMGLHLWTWGAYVTFEAWGLGWLLFGVFFLVLDHCSWEFSLWLSTSALMPTRAGCCYR